MPNITSESGAHKNLQVVLPSSADIEQATRSIGPYIRETPMVSVSPGQGTAGLWLKLELLQVTGTFKPRGALNVALNLSEEEVRAGFTTFSSGNHAAAVSYVAKILGTTAKVVMPTTANLARQNACRRYGAELVLVESGAEAMDLVSKIRDSERRTLIHPFEGPYTTLGTATLGVEILHQLPNVDAIVIAIGGGGLGSGVGAAVKLFNPACEVYAVEPTGAATMARSFISGKPETLSSVDTIADTLAPPMTLPYSLSVCRKTIKEIVLVSDDEIKRAMKHLYQEFQLAVEPGGAAALAAAQGPLKERLSGKRTCVVVCGSKIDLQTLTSYIESV